MDQVVPIKILIVEDNIKIQEYLTLLINRYFPEQLQILGYARSTKEAINLIEKTQPELIFMDIKLEDGLAFEIFEQLNQWDFEVIFVTAFDDFYKQAVDYFAFSYVIKPIVVEKFIEIISRYIQFRKRIFSIEKFQQLSSFLQKESTKILIHSGEKYINIHIKDIVKIEADSNYSYFYLKSGAKHLVSKSLKYYEQLFHTKGFFKPHRSVLINIEYIESIYKKETIKLTTGDNVPVAIRNKQKLMDVIKSLS